MKVRIRFAKQGKVRWTSHRDVARMWERAFRRAELPVAHTAGFTPRLKVSFGLALPTGHESLAEYLDAELVSPVDLADLPDRLSAALPVGIDVLGVGIPATALSLQESVVSCTWEAEAVGLPVDEVTDLVSAALAAESIVITRTRKGSETAEDVRPAILAVTIDGPVACQSEEHAPGARLTAELATQPRSLRPAELLAAISPRLNEGHVRRTQQWTMRDGARAEPLSPGSSGSFWASESSNTLGSSDPSGSSAPRGSSDSSESSDSPGSSRDGTLGATAAPHAELRAS